MRHSARYSPPIHALNVVDARVYEGIHFRFADTAARKQGIQVARWAFENFLRPLDEVDHHGDNDDHDKH